MTAPAQRARWELTASALQTLLHRLDADPERAGEAYERLRFTLTKFFDWRGAPAPDECADETINRLARKLEEGSAVADLRNYSLGIARLVLLEQARAARAREVELEEDAAHVQSAPAEPASPLQDCLDTCLSTLAPDARTLILEYYQDQRQSRIDRRARLAQDLGLSANALRSRAQRVRDRLERCVRDCAAGGTGQPGAGA